MNIWIRLAVAVVPLSLGAARLIWPTLNIDEITLGLLFLAALIVFALFIKNLNIKSFELPGVKVTMDEMNVAAENVTGSVEITGDDKETTASVAEVLLEMAPAKEDPNLALVHFRIEVEKRLRKLAVVVDIEPDQALSKLLASFDIMGTLGPQGNSGVRDIIRAGNLAVHGATLEPGLADWVADNAAIVLVALDAINARETAAHLKQR